MSLLVINKSSPYGNASGQESVDLVMASANFGQSVGVVFIGDGVFQLLQNQEPGCIEHKHYSKGFAALEFYDVEDIYVCADSLKQRHIITKDLTIEVQLLKPNELASLLPSYDHIVTF